MAGTSSDVHYCVEDVYAVAIDNNRFRFFTPFAWENFIVSIQLTDYSIIDNQEVDTPFPTFNN
jgi:hypothetical protein